MGLTDELGRDRFNPPSLRGVKFRRALLHDGSAKSLEEVFDVHPGLGVEVSTDDLPGLIAFLRTLWARSASERRPPAGIARERETCVGGATPCERESRNRSLAPGVAPSRV